MTRCIAGGCTTRPIRAYLVAYCHEENSRSRNAVQKLTTVYLVRHTAVMPWTVSVQLSRGALDQRDCVRPGIAADSI
jgi:hypothetical protein